MNASIRHIVWDWNGTLINDIVPVAHLTNHFLVEFGRERISIEEYRAIFTFPIRNFWESAVGVLTDEVYDKLNNDFHAEYLKERGSAKLHVEVLKILPALSQNSIASSVLSAHPHEMLLEAIDVYGLKNHFQNVVGHHTAGESKIELGRELLTKLPYPTNEILMIGDTTHDFEVAEALGMQCALIANGFQDEKRLRSVHSNVFPTLQAWFDVFLMESRVAAA